MTHWDHSFVQQIRTEFLLVPENPPSTFHSIELDIFLFLEISFKHPVPWPYVPRLYDFEVVGNAIWKQPRAGKVG